MLTDDVLREAEKTLTQMRQRGLKLTTAESCTGGLIAAALTSFAGSSDVFERGFVTYSDEAKTTQLGVPAELIATHGAVSQQVAAAMACGARANSNADIAVSVTGIAGPGGGSPDKPVGLVFFAAVGSENTLHESHHIFKNADRHEIRCLSVSAALGLVQRCYR